MPKWQNADMVNDTICMTNIDLDLLGNVKKFHSICFTIYINSCYPVTFRINVLFPKPELYEKKDEVGSKT